jgi:predicted nucleic acid-binding protein
MLRKDRPRYIEEWVDKATGQKLGIDENDLWMCAQAKERNLVLVTADGRMKRIPNADPEVRLLTI